MINTARPEHTRLAIVAALQEEVSHILEHMHSRKCETIAGRNFWTATYQGHAVVIVLSGIGKVAAAITATTLVERFGVHEILFTGVAGAINDEVSVGDVVIGTNFIQHDMDASPLFPRYLVPGYAEIAFQADTHMSQRLKRSSAKVLSQLEQTISIEIVDQFKLQGAQVHEGLILSGDQFVSDEWVRQGLRQAHSNALVVEMEGAALAQVCKDYGVAFALMRTVSDGAGEHAAIDFTAFLHAVASRYSALIVEAYLNDVQ
jgi:adenosylhomocysteine nucleosidase